jgi:hypothetical protein
MEVFPLGDATRYGRYTLIPDLVAHTEAVAVQAGGFVWNKTDAMPESVKDRLSNRHEEPPRPTPTTRSGSAVPPSGCTPARCTRTQADGLRHVRAHCRGPGALGQASPSATAGRSGLIR